jgi:hypothetical protein
MWNAWERLRNAYRVLVGKIEGRNNSEDLGVDGWIILEWILGKYGENVWTGFICLRIGTSDGLV